MAKKIKEEEDGEVMITMDELPPSAYCMIPNVYLDKMSSMGEAEFKVFIAIALGWFRWDQPNPVPNLRYLIEKTGMDQEKVLDACRAACRHGFLRKRIAESRTMDILERYEWVLN